VFTVSVILIRKVLPISGSGNDSTRYKQEKKDSIDCKQEKPANPPMNNCTLLDLIQINF
tara:strand:- start:73039 stop:73215 length:177 start_codon:yes stop_codon:yes gene_type:complete